MNIEGLYDAVKPRHRVWVSSDELTAGTIDGTWTLVDTDMAEKLGFGSEIFVIDKAGTILLWDSENQCATVWAGSMA